MAAQEDNRGQFAGINAIGTAEWRGQRMGQGDGADIGRGNLDQPLPCENIADGQEVSSKDNFKRGVRRDASFARNSEIYRKDRR
jgi:hypothetical protein